jgi:GTP cyclohydrolase I
MPTDYTPLPHRTVNEAEAIEHMRLVLLHLGYDAARSEGLVRTPERYVRAMQEMLSGAQATDDAVKALLAVSFDAGDYDQIAAVVGIPFTSLCEHHLLPFSGFASVAYLPSGERMALEGESLSDARVRWRVVGLSKLPRLVDVFARRLQLQERMTAQIATALQTHVRPRGVSVLVEATHSCVECRGVRKLGVVFRTEYMLGMCRENPDVRAEVLEKMRMPL